MISNDEYCLIVLLPSTMTVWTVVWQLTITRAELIFYINIVNTVIPHLLIHNQLTEVRRFLNKLCRQYMFSLLLKIWQIVEEASATLYNFLFMFYSSLIMNMSIHITSKQTIYYLSIIDILKQLYMKYFIFIRTVVSTINF